MPGIAVNVAVLHQGKILLTQREDFETWILPSGGVEEGESVAQAAIRETKEETGLDIELIRLVGIYSRLGNLPGTHAVLFTARPVGGEIKCQPGETIAVEWFPFDAIPSPLAVGHRKRIEDAIAGASGVAVLQNVIRISAPSEDLSWDELINLRDKSGLPRQAFWLRLMEQTSLQEEIELGGNRPFED
jgi:ADP-ribose pyrophosphatase YjhB (NUDIX family)